MAPLLILVMVLLGIRQRSDKDDVTADLSLGCQYSSTVNGAYDTKGGMDVSHRR